ncbi:Histone-lysine N-methyltransferase H3 lysine-9 specific SUVH6, partial [Bienertia sinuspersici]
MPLSCSDVVENVGFTLDAGNYGNVGRFIIIVALQTLLRRTFYMITRIREFSHNETSRQRVVIVVHPSALVGCINEHVHRGFH